MGRFKGIFKAIAVKASPLLYTAFVGEALDLVYDKKSCINARSKSPVLS